MLRSHSEAVARSGLEGVLSSVGDPSEDGRQGFNVNKHLPIASAMHQHNFDQEGRQATVPLPLADSRGAERDALKGHLGLGVTPARRWEAAQVSFSSPSPEIKALGLAGLLF